MSIMVPTKQQLIVNTQRKTRKECKRNTKESHKTTREETNRRKKQRKISLAENFEQEE